MSRSEETMTQCPCPFLHSAPNDSRPYSPSSPSYEPDSPSYFPTCPSCPPYSPPTQTPQSLRTPSPTSFPRSRSPSRSSFDPRSCAHCGDTTDSCPAHCGEVLGGYSSCDGGWRCPVNKRKSSSVKSVSRSRSRFPKADCLSSRSPELRTRSQSPRRDAVEESEFKLIRFSGTPESAFAAQWQRWNDEGEHSISLEDGKLNVDLSFVHPSLQKGCKVNNTYLDEMGTKGVTIEVGDESFSFEPVEFVYRLKKINKK